MRHAGAREQRRVEPRRGSAGGNARMQTRDD
jgi:hypothetical protein